MKVDTLPDPLPGQPGSMWINPDTGRLMIWDGDGLIPLVALRKQDTERLAVLVAELACPPLQTQKNARPAGEPGGHGV